ncbi:MAG: hypothetical protein Q8T08_21495, partial [Ignavibacteria bacterium]|nr:hypothetical protein [Ignavibacteria bacterium]
YFIFISILLLPSCSKEERPLGEQPSIQFITDAGYSHNDTSLLINEQVKIGINAASMSEEALTQLTIISVKDGVSTSVDSGFYSNNITYNLTINKGIAELEKWKFYVRDRNGNQSDTIEIQLFKDAASIYGPIKTLPLMELGAHLNNQIGSFLSYETDSVYQLNEAYLNQEKIHLVYYFDNIETDANTIASPGANIDASVFPGDFGLSNWTIKNTIRFEFRPLISSDDFNRCENDSLILANTFDFPVGKRKAKNLSNDQIYAFVSDQGVKGLFRVIEVIGTESGTTKVAIKMQAQ